jgi:hypothetical protein
MHLARAEQSLTVFDDATRTLKRQIIAATAA